MRFSIDTGGTFTDLVVEADDGQLSVYKSPTTPDDPVRGILDAFELAATAHDMARDELLRQGTVLTHATTRALNAILSGTTARTAFLTTRGHPDVLLLREGGRRRFNEANDFPEPYVPRSLTFEIGGRIGSAGQVIEPLDEASVLQALVRCREQEVEAIAVCFLWSIVNASHEEAVGRLIEEHLPDIPFTLSHRLNPTLREYRRASSAAIDASLKPAMSEYLSSFEGRIREAGFDGRLLIVTSAGGVLDASSVVDAPIHVLRSGPSMAPVAGLRFARAETEADPVLVADTGGTSYDISIAVGGRIPWTRETWIGEEFTGHMTGFPSIDVRSIGAGGGSIAWVDEGGLLHVGPRSASAVPGPACYGSGGTEPTVTDACVVLGYVDADYFLGGAMTLDVDAARDAIDRHVAQPLGMETDEAASAVVRVVTENMVQLIEGVALAQGVDPEGSVLIGGGGAAGFNATAIGQRLGCDLVIIPEAGPVLSAVGALLSDLTNDHDRVYATTSDRFDFEGVNEVLAELEARSQAFIEGPGAQAAEWRIELSAQVRYPSEIWELEVPLRTARLTSQADIEQLREDFHRLHAQYFGTSDPGSAVVMISWRGRARCRFRDGRDEVPTTADVLPERNGSRRVHFPGSGRVEVPVRRFHAIEPGADVVGPAIIESPVTTVVVTEGARARRSDHGSLVIDTGRSARR